MSTLGNRPDLFGGSEYIGKYYTADYEKYEIPPEALVDAQFFTRLKRGGAPFITPNTKEDTDYVHEEE